MNAINLIFPNQLFKSSELLENGFPVYLIEEFLFFEQYNFHKQKIAFHRATMKQYETFLISKKIKITYVESIDSIADIRKLIPYLKSIGITSINYIDPTDNFLHKRIRSGCAIHNIKQRVYGSPMFLNSKEDLKLFFKSDKKKYHQTTFYKDQRIKRHILIDNDEKPTGGKWTFDLENRKKYPAKKTPPAIQYPDTDAFYKEALEYVSKNFDNNIGEINNNKLYPSNFEESKQWLQEFLKNRFVEFGTYEDAIVVGNSILNHSVLTPMLNIGLLTPTEIIEQAVTVANKNGVPINSLEGFVRQIIGWREFIRGIYESRGCDQRTINFWGFTKKIPTSFYDGTTGIYPVDQTIKQVLKTGYCHHIERLMVLGNFMMLCEFDPDEVYKWFMELFIDSYDWVMVPNVYGMSQFSDGGLMATKPYISGSNYIMKMSNYKKGEWQKIWDGLFWRFMDTHRNFFSKNPRLGMLVSMFDKMPFENQQKHIKNAEIYLAKL